MGAQNRIVTVEVPVPEDVARLWQTLPEAEKKRLGVLVQAFVTSAVTPGEAFASYFRRLDAEAEASGLTDDIVDEELAAYNAERRG